MRRCFEESSRDEEPSVVNNLTTKVLSKDSIDFSKEALDSALDSESKGEGFNNTSSVMNRNKDILHIFL